jgi:hypothetical protein
VGVPPVTATFCSAFAESKNPIHWPSGQKKRPLGIPSPPIGRWLELIERPYVDGAVGADIATGRPSGEIAISRS